MSDQLKLNLETATDVQQPAQLAESIGASLVGREVEPPALAADTQPPEGGEQGSFTLTVGPVVVQKGTNLPENATFGRWDPLN